MTIVEHAPFDLLQADERDAPRMPAPVGPLSRFTSRVIQDPTATPGVEELLLLDIVEPLGDLDLQRSLHCLHELHFRGVAAAHPDAEWHPGVVGWWHRVAAAFERGLRVAVDVPAAPLGGAGEALTRMIDDFQGPSLSGHVRDQPSLAVLREFAIHRSAYQLKEADPHTFALPRVGGAAKAAFVEIQMDEYGDGRPGRWHADLFRTTMRGLGLDATYGAHVDRLPAATLATGNLIAHLALHRRLLPALLGHLALFEMTSVEPMRRYGAAMRAVGMDDATCEFYDVHVEADEHHGPLARRGLVDAHVAEHPADASLVLWGAAATLEVEARFAQHLLDRWSVGESSLLPGGPLAGQSDSP